MLNNIFKLGLKQGKKPKITFIKKVLFKKIYISDKKSPKLIIKDTFKKAIPFIFFQKKKIKKKEVYQISNMTQVKINNIIFKWLFQASTFKKKKRPFCHEFYINLINTSKNTGKIIQIKKNYQKLIEKSK